MWDKVIELVGGSATVIGGLIGGPAGAAVGGLIGKALGVDSKPESIENALVNNPDALVRLENLNCQKRLLPLKLSMIIKLKIIDMKSIMRM